jgi:hypothetical protein
MNSKLIVFVGAIVTIVGLFLPIANTFDPTTAAPVTINLLLPNGALGDGIVTLVLAIICAVLALINQTKHALWPALIGLGYLIWRFTEIKGAIDTVLTMLSQLSPEAAANVGVNWLGWGVLFAGSVILVIGGALAWKKTA